MVLLLTRWAVRLVGKSRQNRSCLFSMTFIREASDARTDRLRRGSGGGTRSACPKSCGHALQSATTHRRTSGLPSTTRGGSRTVYRPCPDLRGGCAGMRIPKVTEGGSVTPPPTQPPHTPPSPQTLMNTSNKSWPSYIFPMLPWISEIPPGLCHRKRHQSTRSAIAKGLLFLACPPPCLRTLTRFTHRYLLYPLILNAHPCNGHCNRSTTP